MQDTLDITGAGYEYNFIWLYAGYSVLAQERIQHRSATVVWLTGVQGANLTPDQGCCAKKRCGNGVPRRIARGEIPPKIPKSCIKIMVNQEFDV